MSAITEYVLKGTEELTDERGYPDLMAGPKDRNDMYLIVHNGEHYALDFLCPCGCGRSCYTALKPGSKREPSWIATVNGEKVTLMPSIRFTGGCKAHFTITNGKVAFAGDSGK